MIVKINGKLVLVLLAALLCVDLLVNPVRFTNLVERAQGTTRSVQEQTTPVKKHEFIHDDPAHYWHWTREKPPCPTLSEKNDCDNVNYKELYNHFHEYGWVTFTSCSLKENSEKILDPIIHYLQNEYGDKTRVNTIKMKEVKDLALDPDTLEFLAYLHGGRRPLPTQTLNFKLGTQQELHSDVVFFDSEPRALVAAAWVALEDMSDDNGPLRFIPKSHQWGVWDFEAIGLHWEHDLKNTPEARDEEIIHYSNELPKAIKRAGLEESRANNVKRGQTFIWAAGLVHGGSKINNEKLTRMSQVTHYFFEGSKYCWQPSLSRPHENKISFQYKHIKPCGYQRNEGLKPEYPCVEKAREEFRNYHNEEM